MITANEMNELRSMRQAILTKGRKAVKQNDRLLDLMERFNAAVDAVADYDLRAVAHMYYWEACSIIKMAERTHYSESTVKRKLKAATAEIEKAP